MQDYEPQPSSGRQLTHTVQEGESLESIATKYYGRPGEWPRLFHANRHIGTLTAGKQMVIPR